MRGKPGKEVAVHKKLAGMLVLGVAFGIWSCGNEGDSPNGDGASAGSGAETGGGNGMGVGGDMGVGARGFSD